MIKIIKIGGNVVDNPLELENFCRDFSSLEGPKILVHGGGAVANKIQEALGRKPLKIEGRRVTDEKTLGVVTMVYSGLCNKTIVSLLQKYGCNALGLSGCDGDCIRASKRGPLGGIDYGYIGDVKPESINKEFFLGLLSAGITPVVCAINHDGKGQLLNTNADTIASSIASALGAELTICFEKDGVLLDLEDPGSLVREISRESYLTLKADGTVSQGMIPKIENAFKAISLGAWGVTIKNSRNLLNDIGTLIR